ncbi:MAG: hypothetical protein JW727_04200 [Candidatus Aenigmarchaeota archaeon]|nr:hypothetical protein [Candidatus Aenigmarchaeota archaeon]
MGGPYREAVLFRARLPNGNSPLVLTYIDGSDYHPFMENIITWSASEGLIEESEDPSKCYVGFPRDTSEFLPRGINSRYKRAFLLGKDGLSATVINGSSREKYWLADPQDGQIVLKLIKDGLADFQDQPFSPRGIELHSIGQSALEVGMISPKLVLAYSD